MKILTNVWSIFSIKTSKITDLKKNLNSKAKISIFMYLFICSATLLTQLILIIYYISNFPILVTFLNFFLFLIYFTIILYSLIRIIKLHLITEDLKSSKNYNKTLSNLYDNVKAFKHDFDNIIFIIGGYIEQNDIVGLKNYYINLKKDCDRVNTSSLLNPKLINNSGIYNLLVSKYKKAHELNIEIKLDFFFDFTKLNMPIYDFSRILGILLDNALEAACESSKKQVNILFRDSTMNKTQIINIQNTYNNKNINTSEIFEKGKTTKKNHTGMGLWEVNHILKRNSNVTLKTSKDDSFFTQNLEIYY